VTIVIMCGALSGFHALIASGTTPKMIDKESDIRPVAYGAMLVEGMVSITALVAACALEPGDYFKINAPEARYADMIREAKPGNDWMLHPVEFDELKDDAGIKEKLQGRTAGAVTLALGMAKILASLPGMKPLMAYLYHFAIMFESLFILTLLETGTRVARFILAEAVDQFRPGDANNIPTRSASEESIGRAAPDVPRKTSWTLNIVTSLAVCFCWGYLLYTGDIDRLWRILGIANQLLAVIGLAVGTTYLLLHAPKRVYALSTAIPFVLVVASVFSAGVWSIAMWWREIADANVKLACGMAATMLALSAVVVVNSVGRWYQIVRTPTPAGASSVAEAVAEVSRS